MDALQQQSHRFMAPPPQQQQQPPHMADPHHHQHQQQPRPPPPHQGGGSWHPGQFQFQGSQQAPPPPPPPHNHHHQQQQQPMWGAPPPPPPPPYSGHPSQPQNHYYPPPPPPHHQNPYSHPHQAYPQTWQNPNQAYHQGWEHPDRGISHNNEEDWAARARAWAEAKSSTENHQIHHPQFPPISMPEEHNHTYHDQYRQAVDPRYTDVHQPATSHQQFSVSSSNLNRPPVNHLQESTFTYGPASSDVSDTQTSVLTQGITPPNSSIHQQEVPSSYSSIPGKEGAGDQHEQYQRPPPLPNSLAQEGRSHMQFTVPAPGRSHEQPHFPFSNRPPEFASDPSDRPLEFTTRFTREHDPYSQGSYTHHDQAGTQGPTDPIAASSALHAMTPSGVPGAPYPPIPPVPSGLQFDPSFVGPAIPGHAATMFGQISGQQFRPNIPNVSGSFGLGSGTMLHHGDVNGFSNISERPKKAPVPNWLREEIIKKKAVIASSSQEYPERNPNDPVDEDDIDRTFANGLREGNRSTDSSRLSDDEDDEDDLEAARTAAINKEIKRVLTEVLLKVTDDLFDEIATDVLSEDDHSVEVNHKITPPNREVFSSPPAVPVAKASAKVLIPVKGKETEATDASEKSSSGAPGDVLGLASYASDDEDGEETQSPNIQTSRHINAAQHQSSNDKLSGSIPEAVDNGNSHDGPSGDHIYREIEHDRSSSTRVRSQSAGNNGLNDNGADEQVNLENYRNPSHFKGSSRDLEDKIRDDVRDIATANVAIGEKDTAERKVSMKPQLPVSNKKPVMDDSQERESRSRSHQNDDQEGKISSAEKDSIGGGAKVKEDEKHSHSSDAKRQDHRHVRKDRDGSKDDRKEKPNDRDGSKERVKDRGSKHEERAKESNYRKTSKDDENESENLKKVGDKEDSKRKRERTKDEKGDRSKHRDTRDSSHHKRRRSPSTDNDSSNGASEDSSQRKARPKKRSMSPSPTRSRRRQVSRSPHSKHSQRRHSPYSSLENTRRRRSRSSSPAHRRR